jgi:uncharacterized protein YuzE
MPDEFGSAYIHISSGEVAKTVSREVMFDLDADGNLLGIEILDCPNIAERWPSKLSRISMEGHIEQIRQQGENE